MLLHRERRDRQRLSDADRRQAAHHELRHFCLAARKTAGVEEQRRDFMWTRRLDDDGRLTSAGRPRKTRGMDQQPWTRRRAQAETRRPRFGAAVAAALTGAELH